MQVLNAFNNQSFLKNKFMAIKTGLNRKYIYILDLYMIFKSYILGYFRQLSKNTMTKAKYREKDNTVGKFNEN